MSEPQKNWQEIYQKFLANEHIKRVVDQIQIPQLSEEADIELFFSVLGDRGNKLNKEGQLADKIGFTPGFTKIVMSTLRDIAESQTWTTLRESNDLKKSGWHPER